ncbi:MAG: GTA-gp10 family protein [Pseudomonadota bacterium]
MSVQTEHEASTAPRVKRPAEEAESLHTHVIAEFAGERRRFELVAPVIDAINKDVALNFELDVGPLDHLAARIASRSLGATTAKKIIAHGLAQGSIQRYLRLKTIVEVETAGQPFTAYYPLAARIIVAAYAGIEDPSAPLKELENDDASE